MDLLGAALPNVMFVVGVLALGLGLGIELKIVSLNKEINKSGRIGAFIAGVALIVASIVMYLNPAIANRGQASNATTSGVAVVSTQAAAASATTALPPTSAPIDTTAAPAAASLPAPTDTTPAQPTAAAAAAATVIVPDVRGISEKDARRKLEQAGLRAGEKTDQCEGTDQGSPETKKGRILCQNPAPGQTVAPGTAVDYVLAK